MRTDEHMNRDELRYVVMTFDEIFLIGHML